MNRSHLLPLLLTTIITPSQIVAAEGRAGKFVAGPVPASLIRVIDGDTVLVDAMPWPGQYVRVAVRLRGIDAPELRSSCPAERKAAQRTRQALKEMAAGRDIIELENISGGKYYGRVLADIRIDRQDVGAALLDAGLAVAYDGGRRIKPACSTG